MDVYEVVDQVVKLLQQRGRLTYRSLKVQFQLDDETFEAWKDELLFSHPVVDQDGRGVVWTGASEAKPAPVSAARYLRPLIASSKTWICTSPWEHR